MVGRRADQPHTGRRIPDPGDDLVHFVAGKLASFTWLGSLGDLDLELIGIGQIPHGDTEATRGHLFDGRALGIPTGERLETLRVFAALACVGFSADAVHGQSQGFVSLYGDRPEAHGPGAEALDDFAGRLHLFQRNRAALFGLKSQKPPQGAASAGILVEHLGVALVGFLAIGTGCHLQIRNHLRIPDVLFTPGPPVKLPGVGKHGLEVVFPLGITLAVAAQGFGGNQFQVDPLHPAGGSGEAALDNIFPQTHGFKDLGSLVTLKGGDAHLGHDLEHPLGHALSIGGNDGLVRVVVFKKAIPASLPQCFESQIGIDGIGAIADQKTVVMDFPSFTCFQHDSNAGPLGLLDQMMMHGPAGHQRAQGYPLLADGAIREDHQAKPLIDGLLGLGADAVQGRHHPLVAFRLGPGDIDGLGFPAGMVHLLDGTQLFVAENGMRDF